MKRDWQRDLQSDKYQKLIPCVPLEASQGLGQSGPRSEHSNVNHLQPVIKLATLLTPDRTNSTTEVAADGIPVRSSIIKYPCKESISEMFMLKQRYVYPRISTSQTAAAAAATTTITTTTLVSLSSLFFQRSL